MKQSRDLYDTLKQMFSEGDCILPAIVKSVDKTKAVCDVEFNGLEIGDVRLMSVVDVEIKGVKLFPKIESVVLIEKMGNKGEFIIRLMSEIEEVSSSIGDTSFKQDLNGFEIAKGGDSLQKCFDDLFKQIAALTVPVVSIGSPSGTPVNTVAFTLIQKRINNILK